MARLLAPLLVLASFLAACGREQPEREQDQPRANEPSPETKVEGVRHKSPPASLGAVRRSTPVAEGAWRRFPRIAGAARDFPENLRAVIAGDEAIIIAGQSWPRDEDPRESREAQDALGGVAFSLDGGVGRLLPQPSVRRPSPHTRYSAVSDGRTVYLWGGGAARIGDRADEGLASGAAYDVPTDRWRRIPRAPFGSQGHTAIWSGEEMIVWGGVVHSECVRHPGRDTCEFRERQTNRGAAYDPAANAWRAIAASPLAPRTGAAAVWTGREMIVWGGVQTHPRQRPDHPPIDARGPDFETYADAAAYDPRADSWRRIAKAPVASSGRHGPPVQAVWTGRRMIVWNGEEGAVYSPQADRWRRMAPAPLRARFGSSMVWTGKRMILWKNRLPARGSRASVDGALYDPRKDRWELLPKPESKMPHEPAVAWTGEGLLVWGDRGVNRAVLGGALFVPPEGG